jgi:hypothetical protein
MLRPLGNVSCLKAKKIGLESGTHFYNFDSDKMIIRFYRKNKQMILQIDYCNLV